MSELITQKTAEFVEACVSEIVDSCILIASETKATMSMWGSPEDMRREICKRLEVHKDDMTSLAQSRILR